MFELRKLDLQLAFGAARVARRYRESGWRDPRPGTRASAPSCAAVRRTVRGRRSRGQPEFPRVVPRSPGPCPGQRTAPGRDERGGRRHCRQLPRRRKRRARRSRPRARNHCHGRNRGRRAALDRCRWAAQTCANRIAAHAGASPLRAGCAWRWHPRLKLRRIRDWERAAASRPDAPGRPSKSRVCTPSA